MSAAAQPGREPLALALVHALAIELDRGVGAHTGGPAVENDADSIARAGDALARVAIVGARSEAQEQDQEHAPHAGPQKAKVSSANTERPGWGKVSSSMSAHTG